MKVSPLFNDFGVLVEGLDPSSYATESTRAALQKLVNDHRLVLIRDTDLQPEDQVKFSEILGPINRRGVSMPGGKTHAFVSNAVKDGFLRDGEIFFHSDQTYFSPPMQAISLYAIEIPSKGGDTRFLDSIAAYKRLPESMKQRLQGLEAFHAHDYSENKYTQGGKGKVDLSLPNAVSAIHPVVWTHPILGEPLLLVNRSQTQYILGMDPAESESLLNELYAHIENDEHIYTHKWAVGDLLIWDNWSLQHARTLWDSSEKRTLRRVPIGPDSLPLAAAS